MKWRLIWSGQVAPQTSGRTNFHDTKIIPSSLFPTVLRRPGEEFQLLSRMVDDVIEGSTSHLSGHVILVKTPQYPLSISECVEHRLVVPRHNPTATLKELSSNLRQVMQQENHAAKLLGVSSLAASSLALSLKSSKVSFSWDSVSLITLILSQFISFSALAPTTRSSS